MWHWLAVLDGQQVLHRGVQGRHLDDVESARRGTSNVGAIAVWGEEDRGALPASGEHLQLNATDRLHRAVGGDLAGSGDERALGEVAVADLIHDPECEHQPGGWAADLTAEPEVDLERGEALVTDRNSDHGALLARARLAQLDRRRHWLAQPLERDRDGISGLVVAHRSPKRRRRVDRRAVD